MSSFTATLAPKRGFHPTFRTHISIPNGPRKARRPHLDQLHDGDPRLSQDTEDRANCTLHVAHTLPSALLADPYELELRRDEYAFVLWGERNLEFPVHAMPGTGQRLLLNVTLPAEARELVVELPLHLRYAEPGAGGHKSIPAPSPAVFWACPATSECDRSVHPVMSHRFIGGQRREFTTGSVLPVEIDALFGPSVALQGIQRAVPLGRSPLDTVEVPVGDLAHLALVDVGTALVILLCFAYIAVISWRAAQRIDTRPGPQRVKVE